MNKPLGSIIKGYGGVIPVTLWYMGCGVRRPNIKWLKYILIYKLRSSLSKI